MSKRQNKSVSLQMYLEGLGFRAIGRTLNKSFAIRIVNAYKFLTLDKREFILSKQLVRSGTAVGALVRESEFAQSKKDFLSKLYIALKEANETQYWLEILHETDFLKISEYNSLSTDCVELIKLLVSITKTTKNRLE